MLKELVDEQLVFLHPAVKGTTSRTWGESTTGHVLIQRYQNLMGLLKTHKKVKELFIDARQKRTTKM